MREALMDIDPKNAQNVIVSSEEHITVLFKHKNHFQYGRWHRPWSSLESKNTLCQEKHEQKLF